MRKRNKSDRKGRRIKIATVASALGHSRSFTHAHRHERTNKSAKTNTCSRKKKHSGGKCERKTRKGGISMCNGSSDSRYVSRPCCSMTSYPLTPKKSTCQITLHLQAVLRNSIIPTYNMELMILLLVVPLVDIMPTTQENEYAYLRITSAGNTASCRSTHWCRYQNMIMRWIAMHVPAILFDDTKIAEYCRPHDNSSGK